MGAQMIPAEASATEYYGPIRAQNLRGVIVPDGCFRVDQKGLAFVPESGEPAWLCGPIRVRSVRDADDPSFWLGRFVEWIDHRNGSRRSRLISTLEQARIHVIRPETFAGLEVLPWRSQRRGSVLFDDFIREAETCAADRFVELRASAEEIDAREHFAHNGICDLGWAKVM